MKVDSCDENIILGTVGAFAGALIGYIIWICCGYFGIIPGFVGFIFAYLSIKGYLLLGKSISRKGLIICIIICLLLILISEIGAVVLHIYFDWDIHGPKDILQNIFNYIKTEKKTTFVIGNTLLGIFTFAIGCFNMYFRLWRDTSDGPKENVKIDNSEVFDTSKIQRREIPVGEHKKLVAGLVIGAVIYVIIMTIWGVNRY